MRFGLWLSRSGAVGNELLQVEGEPLQQRLETTGGCGGEEQPASDLALDLVDGQGAVDLLRRA